MNLWTDHSKCGYQTFNPLRAVLYCMYWNSFCLYIDFTIFTFKAFKRKSYKIFRKLWVQCDAVFSLKQIQKITYDPWKAVGGSGVFQLNSPRGNSNKINRYHGRVISVRWRDQRRGADRQRRRVGARGQRRPAERVGSWLTGGQADGRACVGSRTRTVKRCLSCVRQNVTSFVIPRNDRGIT